MGATTSSAFVIAVQVDNLTFACSYGIQVATVALVGFEIGAGDLAQARKISKYLFL